MAKKQPASTPEIERVYNVPLRKEYMKVPRYKRAKKATSALRQFLQRHMRSEQVKLGRDLNEEVWRRGIKKPPHHIKVTVTKDKEGLVKADLFGKKEKSSKKKEEAKVKKT